MPDPISKTQRWLDLISYLVSRRIPVTVDELMERIPAYAVKWQGTEKDRASVRRTFERDKDELRALGIPIQTRTLSIDFGAESREAYVLDRRDFYLPYLRVRGMAPPAGVRFSEPMIELEPGEWKLALDSLGAIREAPGFPFEAEAASAYRKLTFDLDRDPGGSSGAPVRWAEPPGAREIVGRVRALSEALLGRKRVSFRYHGIERGEATDREVEPYGVFFQRDWYLVGRDRKREAMRVFRVGRMDAPRVNALAPRTRDYEIPEEFSLRAYLRKEAWELGGEEEAPVEAVVLFRFPASLVADRNGHGELVRERPDGSAERRFRLRQPEPFVRWVLAQAGDAEMLYPPELVDRLRKVADRVRSLHGGEADA